MPPLKRYFQDIISGVDKDEEIIMPQRNNPEYRYKKPVSNTLDVSYNGSEVTFYVYSDYNKGAIVHIPICKLERMVISILGSRGKRIVDV